MNGSRREWVSAGLAVVCGFACVSLSVADGVKPDAPAPVARAVEPPAFEDFLVLPLRFHVLSADLPEIDCKLADADLKRILGKVNTIWHQAGIHWNLEAIVREPAARLDEFKKARESKSDRELGLFRMLAPISTKTDEGLHVYYIHNFTVNGVYLGNHVAFVKETANLRNVEGGIDEPIPRVTAHELGHALGLPHRQDRFNLLASGTTGTLLNSAEIERARSFARKVVGMRRARELVEAVEAAVRSGDPVEARRLQDRMREIPGAPKSS